MANSTKLVLQPPKLQNPFPKVNIDEPSDEASSTTNKASNAEETSSSSSNSEGSSCSKTPVEETKPKFIPLVSSTKDDSTNNAVPSNPASSSSATPSFVFGQNLKERVAGNSEEASESTSEEVKSAANENGASELLFSNAAVMCRSTNRSGLTLSEAAQELEEATRAKKRKYNEVQLLTGEEGETNILQINCKLYTYDKVRIFKVTICAARCLRNNWGGICLRCFQE